MYSLFGSSTLASTIGLERFQFNHLLEKNTDEFCLHGNLAIFSCGGASRLSSQAELAFFASGVEGSMRVSRSPERSRGALLFSRAFSVTSLRIDPSAPRSASLRASAKLSLGLGSPLRLAPRSFGRDDKRWYTRENQPPLLEGNDRTVIN
jgi:hypothetical protein